MRCKVCDKEHADAVPGAASTKSWTWIAIVGIAYEPMIVCWGECWKKATLKLQAGDNL